MKLYLGSTPVKSLNVRKLDVDTSDATIVASDMQSGRTAYANGVKLTGTGKCFAFASYGRYRTNFAQPVPSTINVIEISSVEYPVKVSIALSDMKDVDFTVEQNIGEIVIGGSTKPITVVVSNGSMTIVCDQDIYLQVFYGKDDHA